MSEPLLSDEEKRAIASRIDPDAIREGMARVLSDPKVAGFIRDLLELTSQVTKKRENGLNPLFEGGDLLKVYAKVREQRGVVRGSQSQARGCIAKGDAMIEIGTHMPGGKLTRTAMEKKILEEDIRFAIHETLHLAGMFAYSDEDFAVAVSRILNEVLEEKVLPADRNRFGFSRYWNTELLKRCNLERR